jgi:hypothetical protein
LDVNAISITALAMAVPGHGLTGPAISDGHHREGQAEQTATGGRAEDRLV